MRTIVALTVNLCLLLGSEAALTSAQPQSRVQSARGLVLARTMVESAASCDPIIDYGDANGIALDGDGNVYIARGPAYADGQSAGGIEVQKRSSAGMLLATWTTPGARLGAEQHPVGIALDAHGDVYVSDANAGHIVRLSASGHVLAAWGTSGTAPGRFRQLAGLAVDRRGNVYVADEGNSRIQVFDAAGHLRSVWQLPAVSAQQASRPSGIAVDGRGRIYVADDAIRILILSPSGVVLRAWGSKGDKPTEFRHPVAIALNPRGQLDIADKLNSRLQQFSADGAPITRWGIGEAGTGWFPSRGSAPRQPGFPTGMAVAADGTIYVVAGWCTSRVQTFTPAGRTLAIWSVTA